MLRLLVRALRAAVCCRCASQFPRSFLVAAGLLLHSLFNLETTDLGLRRRRSRSWASLSAAKPQTQRFYEKNNFLSYRAMQSFRCSSRRVFALASPLRARCWDQYLRSGYTPALLRNPCLFQCDVFSWILPGHAIPFLAGRDFTPQDAAVQPPRVAILAAPAQHYFAERTRSEHSLNRRKGSPAPLGSLACRGLRLLRLPRSRGRSL